MTIRKVQHSAATAASKPNEKVGVDTVTDKFVENGTLFLEKYNAWKASLEDKEADVRAN